MSSGGHLCIFCKHSKEGYVTNPKGILICDVFPEGMPRDIFEDRFDHRNPHPEDGGVQFELNTEKFNEVPDYVDRLFATASAREKKLNEVFDKIPEEKKAYYRSLVRKKDDDPNDKNQTD